MQFIIKVLKKPDTRAERFSVYSLIHSDHFYSASSSQLLLRGAPDTARILCRATAS